jgi:hypothetical protein
LRNEKPIIHLLLLSSSLNQAISGKLAVAKVRQNLALLLGFAKDLKLPAPQVFDLYKAVVQYFDSPDSRTVAGQIELHFHRSQAQAQLLLQLDNGIGPIQFCLLTLLFRLGELTRDGFKALLLPPLKALAQPEHGL